MELEIYSFTRLHGLTETTSPFMTTDIGLNVISKELDVKERRSKQKLASLNGTRRCQIQGTLFPVTSRTQGLFVKASSVEVSSVSILLSMSLF